MFSPAAPGPVVVKLDRLGEDHLADLLPLVREYHAFEGVHMADEARRRTVAALLADSRLGEVWGIPGEGGWIGYIALAFGYSIEFQGRDAFIDELFVREAYRGRGLGTRALEQTKARARELGIRALHLEVDRGNSTAQALYVRHGFEARGRFSLMSLKLDADS